MRNEAMDTARGLAVASMVVAHLVSFDNLSPAAQAVAEGTPAVLFFILIGMAWAIQSDRSDSSALRRTLALLALGLLLHIFIWPTEVLVPFAIMLAPSLAIRRGGRWAILGAIAALVAAVVIGAEYFARYSENDWLESGAHLADSQVGWVTLRYLLFDGNYPAIPWLAFPLVGMLYVKNGEVATKPMKATFVIGLILAVAAWIFTSWATGRELPSTFATTWVPTTIPFLILVGGFSLALIAGLSRWPIAAKWLAPVGRASLTHYLAHICLVFVPLRHFYPGEDWPLRTGIIATVAYCVAAVPLSIWWFKTHKRGPVEQLLARLSGAHA